jgi:hypothetical protein
MQPQPTTAAILMHGVLARVWQAEEALACGRQ